MLIRSFLSEKRWPLWNPHAFMGTPLLGNGQISAFTIFAVPVYLFNSLAGHFGEAFLKLLVAGIGMYFLSRSSELGRSASLVSGIVLMLSGHMLAWLHFPLSGGFALSPVLLLAVDKLLHCPGMAWFSFTIAGAAMLMLCGQPQTTFVIGLWIIAYSTYRVCRQMRLIRSVLSNCAQPA
jgi:hypothetical protein